MKHAVAIVTAMGLVTAVAAIPAIDPKLALELASEPVAACAGTAEDCAGDVLVLSTRSTRGHGSGAGPGSINGITRNKAGEGKGRNRDKRDPGPGPDPRGGRGGSRSGGGGATDFAKDVGAGVLSGGVVAGADALLSGGAQAPQKRDPDPDPRGGRGSSRAGGAGDFAKDVGSGVLSGGIIAGADALLNGGGQAQQKRGTEPDPRGSGRGGLPARGRKDIPKDVPTTGTATLDILTGGDELLNPPQKRDPEPRGGRSGSGRGGGASDFAKDVGAGVISGGILAGADQLINPPQKRDPEPRGARSSSGRSGGAGDFAKDVGAGVISGGILAGADQLLNSPQKREPIIGALRGLTRILPDIFSTGAQVAAIEKRSDEKAVEERTTNGKALGKKIGAAIVQDDKESGASEALARPGMLGYLAAGLAVALAAGGFNAAV